MWQNDLNLLYLMQYEFRLDLIRESDLRRLLPTSRVFIPKGPAFYKRFFFWIGRTMITLGSNLVTRFEPITTNLS